MPRRSPPKGKPLTPKERLAVEWFVRLRNKTEALRKAGYSERSAKSQAHDVFSRDRVKQAVDEGIKAADAAVAAARTEAFDAVAEHAKREAVTREYVIDTMREVVERCMQRAPVMVRQGKEYVQAVDDEGRHVWQFDAKGANGALRMLGEHLGVFKMPALPPGAGALGVVLLPALGEGH